MATSESFQGRVKFVKVRQTSMQTSVDCGFATHNSVFNHHARAGAHAAAEFGKEQPCRPWNVAKS
jgi:hypothetical protein